MISDRYRIIGLLGRGGMGEVYRADDLKLGQPVALKFLPPGLEKDPDRAERFLAEVRMARQVTHPNVCRVYDIDEMDGRQFLSMEYVDGEDLSSLLRRIGRLPQERAVEVARQICAGLAAAHDKGILHRDLKPANIMVDGRGQVRLTDFGLAGLADRIKPAEVRSGTPAYMAPEQSAGREVTRRSDIYALGLVLYELFTGQQAEIAGESRPSSLSRYVSDLDPAVERAVLRCLERVPADRPASALAVSASLPGGDPLAAALAAGETPSPELVAQAGESEGMSPSRVMLLTSCALVLAIGGAFWAGTMSLTRFLPMDRRPAVQEDRARSIIAELGYEEDVYADPVDQAWGLVTWDDVIASVGEAGEASGDPWPALRHRPDAVSYWYRQSPQILLPSANNPPVFTRGRVGITNPLPISPGEVSVLLDGAGNLRRFELMPRRYSMGDVIAEPDWSVLFRLAGLDPARFEEDRPRYQRFLAPDRRRAWIGTLAERPDEPLQVEAGSFEGRPVLFNVATVAGLEPLGEQPERRKRTVSWVIVMVVQPLVILWVVILAVRIARRNILQGRADRRGALRFGVLSFGLFLAGRALASHAMMTELWPTEFWELIVGATFIGMVSWSLYTAAEPLGRQVWPTMFVSSSRLLSRPKLQRRDPLIGGSVLVGVLGGSLDFLIQGPVHHLLAPLWTGQPERPLGLDLDLLQGQSQALAFLLDAAVLLTFMLVLIVSAVMIRRLVRNLPIAVGLTLVLWTLMSGSGTPARIAMNFVTAAIMLTILLRWGAVAMVVAQVVLRWLWQARFIDPSAWYSQGSVLVLSAVILLTLYGAWAAVGDRSSAATRR